MDPYFSNYFLYPIPLFSSKSIIFTVCFSSLCIFSNHKLQIDGNYIHKMVIKFTFCVVSLLWTSRYVLICCTLLTHFLCCNLFVMFYLTLSAISANVLEIRLPITSIYPFTDSQLHHKCPGTAFYSDFRECSQNSHGPPCGTIFKRFITNFPNFMGYRMEVGGSFSEFCEYSQNSHSRLTYTAPWFLNY